MGETDSSIYKSLFELVGEADESDKRLYSFNLAAFLLAVERTGFSTIDDDDAAAAAAAAAANTLDFLRRG